MPGDAAADHRPGATQHGASEALQCNSGRSGTHNPRELAPPAPLRHLLPYRQPIHTTRHWLDDFACGLGFTGWWSQMGCVAVSRGSQMWRPSAHAMAQAAAGAVPYVACAMCHCSS